MYQNLKVAQAAIANKICEIQCKSVTFNGDLFTDNEDRTILFRGFGKEESYAHLIEDLIPLKKFFISDEAYWGCLLDFGCYLWSISYPPYLKKEYGISDHTVKILWKICKTWNNVQEIEYIGIKNVEKKLKLLERFKRNFLDGKRLYTPETLEERNYRKECINDITDDIMNIPIDNFDRG
jgi:hypothetical protein